jgi:hypothetical protein
MATCHDVHQAKAHTLTQKLLVCIVSYWRVHFVPSVACSYVTISQSKVRHACFERYSMPGAKRRAQLGEF